MIDRLVTLGDKEIRLDGSLFSAILYENVFNRNFTKDYESLLSGEFSEQAAARFAWTFIKCADSDFMDYDSFLSSYTVGDLIGLYKATAEILAALYQSSSTKKVKAAALRRLGSRLARFLRLPSGQG